jgi:hypothetical protein
MRLQNKIIDELRARLKIGEIDTVGYADRLLYFTQGYDLGHEEGFDEGEEEGKEESKFDTGFTQGRLSAFAEVAEWATEVVSETEAERVADNKARIGVVSGITTARRHGRIRTFTEVSEWASARREVVLKTITD